MGIDNTYHDYDLQEYQDGILDALKAAIKDDTVIAEIKERFDNKTATTIDINLYSQRLGDILSFIYAIVLSPEDIYVMNLTNTELIEIIKPSIDYVLTLIDKLGKGIILQINELDFNTNIKAVDVNGEVF